MAVALINIKEIARLANVSTATVSRVINSPEKVKDDKRILIEKIMQDLDYQPNALARGLIKKSTKTIGIMMPDINNLFYPAVVRGIEDYLEKNDYNAFLCNTDKNIEKEKRYIQALLEKRVDGFIFMGTRPIDSRQSEHIKQLCDKTPVVLVNETIIGSNAYSVLTDEIEGAYKAVEYLIQLGHRKIAYITGENNEYSTYLNKQKGYEMAMHNNGLTIEDHFILSDTPYSTGGYHAALKLLKSPITPTAVFAASDQIAMGVIKAANELGVIIPDALSVVGFANVPMSEDIFPELTTVDQYPYETGRNAAEIITKILCGNEPEQKKLVMQPRLLVRNSCKNI